MVILIPSWIRENRERHGRGMDRAGITTQTTEARGIRFEMNNYLSRTPDYYLDKLLGQTDFDDLTIKNTFPDILKGEH